jgi:hypothetical protein
MNLSYRKIDYLKGKIELDIEHKIRAIDMQLQVKQQVYIELPLN